MMKGSIAHHFTFTRHLDDCVAQGTFLFSALDVGHSLYRTIYVVYTYADA